MTCIGTNELYITLRMLQAAFKWERDGVTGYESDRVTPLFGKIKGEADFGVPEGYFEEEDAPYAIDEANGRTFSVSLDPTSFKLKKKQKGPAEGATIVLNLTMETEQRGSDFAVPQGQKKATTARKPKWEPAKSSLMAMGSSRTEYPDACYANAREAEACGKQPKLLSSEIFNLTAAGIGMVVPNLNEANDGDGNGIGTIFGQSQDGRPSQKRDRSTSASLKVGNKRQKCNDGGDASADESMAGEGDEEEEADEDGNVPVNPADGSGGDDDEGTDDQSGGGGGVAGMGGGDGGEANTGGDDGDVGMGGDDGDEANIGDGGDDDTKCGAGGGVASVVHGKAPDSTAERAKPESGADDDNKLLDGVDVPRRESIEECPSEEEDGIEDDDDEAAASTKAPAGLPNGGKAPTAGSFSDALAAASVSRAGKGKGDNNAAAKPELPRRNRGASATSTGTNAGNAAGGRRRTSMKADPGTAKSSTTTKAAAVAKKKTDADAKKAAASAKNAAESTGATAKRKPKGKPKSEGKSSSPKGKNGGRGGSSGSNSMKKASDEKESR